MSDSENYFDGSGGSQPSEPVGQFISKHSILGKRPGDVVDAQGNVVDKRHLTPLERSQLDKEISSFSMSEESPDEIERQLQQEVERDRKSIASGVSMANMREESVPVESLPPEKQREVHESIQNMVGANTSREQPNMPPGVKPVRQASNQAAAKVMEAEHVDLGDDQANEKSFEQEVDENMTDSVSPSICPQCASLITDTTGIRPSQEEFGRFVMAITTGIPFQQESRVAGGAVRLTFRTLSMYELDQLADELDATQRRDKLNADEVGELYQRLNTALRLVRFDAGDTPQRFPTALDSTVNEKDCWKITGENRIQLIADQVFSRVAVGESMFRVIRISCGKFMRLVGTMEALSLNPNFTIDDLSN